MMWIKLVYPIVIIIWAAWMYARKGWRTGYSMGARGEVAVKHDGRSTVAIEMQSKIGWPIWAVVEIPSARRLSFHVRPEARFHLRRKMRSGHAVFDREFWIAPGSETLTRALLERNALASHFMVLQRQLRAASSKLSRVAAEDGKIAVEVNVRWVHDRPRLYQRLLAWLMELDQLLSADLPAPPVPLRGDCAGGP